MPAIPVAMVDAELCTCCGQCEEICPTRAITTREAAVIEQEACIGCAACVAVCPEGALSLADRQEQQR
jgi:ferredoxin